LDDTDAKGLFGSRRIGLRRERFNRLNLGAWGAWSLKYRGFILKIDPRPFSY
jgi:hypothetical protein